MEMDVPPGVLRNVPPIQTAMTTAGVQKMLATMDFATMFQSLVRPAKLAIRRTECAVGPLNVRDLIMNLALAKQPKDAFSVWEERELWDAEAPNVAVPAINAEMEK